MDELIIAGTKFKSRLIVGTGKFSSNEIMRDAIEASGTDMVTVSIKRMDFSGTNENILDYIDLERVILLPNTAGAQTAEEAVKIARICKEMGLSDWVKLEITSDPYYLLPDPIETLKAAKILVKEGFKVMPYINTDPILAKRLEEVGTVSVMPLGSPIGSNKGLKTLESIKIIIEMSEVPVIVDAGIGRPSDAALAMELGADAVLVNTAIAVANDPVKMADAFREAVIAGRQAYLAGLPSIKEYAEASSPGADFLELADELN